MSNNHPSKQENSPSCPFCHPNKDRKLIAESETVLAIYDKYPVNPGHALIIPKRHCSSFFELTSQEQVACLEMLNEVREILMAQFQPDAFNVGMNIGEIAGQTVPHVHIHLIPRFVGDVKDPRGGVRGVIPEKQKY